MSPYVIIFLVAMPCMVISLRLRVIGLQLGRIADSLDRLEREEQ